MKRFLVFALALSLFLSLFSTGLAGKENNTFIYGIEGDPGNDVNTISTSGRYDLMTERMIYNPLYSYYGPDDLHYFLAKDVQVSEDGLSITVTLRDDVLWHDGTPFTADDVVFTFEHIIKAPHANGHEGLVFDGQATKVEAKDAHTVVFTTPIFVASMLENLAGEHYIMPKHIYEDDETLDNNPKNQTPIGTGPYKMAEYKAGQYVKFTANKDYYKGEPKIETIFYQIVSDANSAMLALKTGQINALVLNNDAADDFKDSDVEVIAYPEDRVGYASFIMTSDKVQDLNFRKAVFFALDRHEMNIGAYLSEDYFVDAVSFLPYTNPFFTKEVESYERNLDKAKEHLAKVDKVPDSISVAYIAGNFQQEVQALVMQQNLKDIGVKVEIAPMDSTALYEGLRKGTSPHDIFLGGYIMGVDPSSYAALYVSDAGSNYSRMKNPELDELFRAGSVETDPEKRMEIYKKAQQVLADFAIQYPIVTNSRLLGITKDVSGIEEARLIPIYTFNDMSELYFK